MSKKNSKCFLSKYKDSFEIVADLLLITSFNEFPTYEVYDCYTKHCIKKNVPVIHQLEFSKFVCNYFDYTILDKKVKRLGGKKCRVFIKCNTKN